MSQDGHRQGPQFSGVSPPSPGYPPLGRPPGNPEKGNRGKIVLFAGLSLGLIAVVVAGLTVFRSALIPAAVPSSSTSGDRGDGRSSGTTTHAVKESQLGATITPQTLAWTDGESLFWGMLRNQLQRPVHVTRRESYFNTDDFNLHRGIDVQLDRIDYFGRKIVRGKDSWGSNGLLYSQRRCMGDKGEYRTSLFSHYQWEMTPGSCVLNNAVGLGDGIAPGGLTAEQASTYMAYINSKYGDPITAARPELFEHKGKQYVKLPVTITPVDTGDPAYGYVGMQLFIWALRAAGIDPQTYPYSGWGASGSGYEITYYIDPNTTLPAYSFLRETSALDDQGKPKDTPEDLPIRRVQYEWPNQWNPFSPDNPDDLKPAPLTWDRSIQ